MEPALAQFVRTVEPALTRSDDHVADTVERALRPLMAQGPGLLAEPERRPLPDRYTQHVLYVHPSRAYSVVSLVWLPGQATPIHDHTCWCVTGVLEGAEEETTYSLHEEDDGCALTVLGRTSNRPGETSRLVPPAENIHRVANAGDALAISVHVYGADIAARGTSVNQVFDAALVATPTVPARSWRAGT